jgi:hypothetical protein
MLRILSTLILSLTFATGAAAQSDGDAFDLGTDRFRAGSEVRFEASGAGDVFLAGERVTLAAPIDGSAHLAGRLIVVEGAVAAALYAMGYDLAVSAPVGGAATLAGYAIRVDAPVAGNLRATGMRVTLAADVGGAALLAGRDVEIEGTIAGDAVLAAETLSFGPDARIEGQVTLYSDDDVDLDVPASVAPPERIDRRSLAEYQGDERTYMRMTLGERIAAFGGALLVLTLVTTLAVTIAPQGFDRLRRLVGEAPWRALGTGFLALSLLFGAAFMLILTVIGIVVAPIALIAAVLLSIAGYIVAVYLLGVWLVTRGNMMEPDTFPEFALTALAGALVAGLLALIPFLGWIVPPALALTGAGALTLAAFGRRLGY